MKVYLFGETFFIKTVKIVGSLENINYFLLFPRNRLMEPHKRIENDTNWIIGNTGGFERYMSPSMIHKLCITNIIFEHFWPEINII